jgi:hypothetical protein
LSTSVFLANSHSTNCSTPIIIIIITIIMIIWCWYNRPTSGGPTVLPHPKNKNEKVRTVGIPAETQTGHLSNTSQSVTA